MTQMWPSQPQGPQFNPQSKNKKKKDEASKANIIEWCKEAMDRKL
jgi:hypothetical protein